MPISEWIHNEIMDYVCGYTNILLYAYFVKAGKLLENKTQWLCKRLAGPIIPLSWSNMVWKKGFTYGCGRWGAVNSHSPVCWVIFGMVTPEQPNHRVILVQACSWPVRRQSLSWKPLIDMLVCHNQFWDDLTYTLICNPCFIMLGLGRSWHECPSCQLAF